MEDILNRLTRLRELGLKNSSLQLSHSLEQKIKILEQHFINNVPISELSSKYSVSRMTIYRWIHTFADGKSPSSFEDRNSCTLKPRLVMSKKNPVVPDSGLSELERLREENRRLSEALKMSEWMNHAKDVMIDEAEKTFNIPIRKKSGAKQ